MIPYGRQSIDEDDVNAVVAALKSEFLTTGPLVELFEQKLEDVVGAPCVVVSSGTAALHCAYAAINLQPGDEVVTPPITFIATQATAAMFGAKIVFADVQLDTGNMDPKSVTKAITPRTRAIVAVDYAGHPADLDELREIANHYNIYLIEDASHSLGAKYKNRSVGSIADLTTFSFFPTKIITTSEGGAVASTNTELLEKVKKFSRQGLERNKEKFKIKDQGPWHQEVQNFGLNYRLPDVLCALGITQLEKLTIFTKRRNEIADIYLSELAKIPNVILPTKRDYVEASWHLFPIQVPASHRLKIYNKMRLDGIGVQVNYFPVHRHPVFMSEWNSEDFPVANEFYAREISLPIYYGLSDSQIFEIIRRVQNILENLDIKNEL